MKPKNILIVVDQFSSSKEKDFLFGIKIYLDDKKQNKVHFYFLKPAAQKFPRGREIYSGTIRELPGLLTKKKIDVVAVKAQLPQSVLQQMRKRVAVMANFSGTPNKIFDYQASLDSFNAEAIVYESRRLSVVDKLNWDSDFFGINIARLNHTQITKKLIDYSLKICRQAKIKCLYFRSLTTDPLTIQLAESNGFHFANVRVTYTLDTKQMRFSRPNTKAKSSRLRLSDSKDLPRLLRMSKNLYRDSRFYFDKNFSDYICDKYYNEWIRKLATSKKKSSGVYVLSVGQEIAGYLGYEVEFGTIFIVLAGVGQNYQRQGIGTALLGAFIQKMTRQGYHKYEVVTQGRNIGSQRLYQSYGFKISASEIDYHKWF